jgi:hypothetical protein
MSFRCIISPNRTFMKMFFPLCFLILLGMAAFAQKARTPYPGWVIYDSSNSVLHNDSVHCIRIDWTGTKWFSTNYGLASYDDSVWHMYDHTNSGLQYDHVRRFVIDGNLNTWMGTFYEGFVKYDEHNWDHIFSNYCVWDVAFDSYSNKWVGTVDGLVKYDGFNTTRYNTANSGITFNHVSSVAVDHNDIVWMGTWEEPWGGLARFDGTDWTVYDTSNSAIPGIYITCLTVAPDGALWIGLGGWSFDKGGLVRFDGVDWTIYNTANSGLPSDFVSSIAFGQDGVMWIGTGGWGETGSLARFDGSAWTIYDHSNSGLPVSHIVSITVDSSNVKWIGLDSGLAVFYDTIQASCQAEFTWYADSTSSQVIHLADQSVGNINWWQWDLGDGSPLLTEQNPVVNLSPGYHRICLTVKDTIHSCQDSICRGLVIAADTNLHNVSGRVYAGDAPLAFGIALIISVDSTTSYDPYMDLSSIDTEGAYSFSQVPSGDYFIYAIPILNEEYLPTYYGDVLYWQVATAVHLGQEANPYDIHLVYTAQFAGGPGSIGGEITYSGLKQVTDSTLVGKIIMLLMNAEGIAVRYGQVDASGHFLFSSLPYGEYFLKAELAGVTSDPVAVTISAAHPDGYVYQTLSGNRILGISSVAGSGNSVVLYPNPADGILNISLSGSLKNGAAFRLTDMTGKEIALPEYLASDNQRIVTIPLNSLVSGLYSLSVVFPDGNFIVKKFIKK